MKLAVALLALLVAAPAASQEAGEPTTTVGSGGEHAGWTARRWLTEYYDHRSDRDPATLLDLLENAAIAPERTPLLDQRIAGEMGYLAKGQSQLERAGRAFQDAAKGPDEEAAARAVAEVKVIQGYVLQEGREQRDAGLYDEADATFWLAGDLGADPSVVALERARVEERRNQLAEGGEAAAPTSAPTWGKPPPASEALQDPVPPDLVDEPWLDEFRAEKAAEADPEDLAMILDGLADDDPGRAQRIAIERGMLALEDGDSLAAGRAFLRAKEGDDPDLCTRAQAELRKLQREFRTLAVQQTHLGDIPAADTSFRTAGALGADAQLIAYERSYIAGLDGDEDKVIELLTAASEGPNERVGAQATLELAAHVGVGVGGSPEAMEHITASLGAKEEERWDDADAELDQAEEAGGDHQLIELYRAYVDKAKKDDFAARKHFQEAKKGEDEALSKQARAELRYTAKPFWGDIYADGFGWARVLPESQRFDDFVGTARVRGYVHPFQGVGFDPYIFAQVSGDARSRQDGGAAFGGLPLIYADNTVLLGGGLLLRIWKNRISLWGQAAVAVPWVKPIADPAVQLDVQVGAAIAFANKGCRPPDGKPAYWTTMLCAEFYGDTVYRNRPYNNIFFTARGRIGLHYLVTGPVAWAPMVELRFAKDGINDYWANLVDVGILHRWRLMGPVGIDLDVGIHAGTLLGLTREGQTPPDTLGYVDFRLQVAGYVAF